MSQHFRRLILRAFAAASLLVASSSDRVALAAAITLNTNDASVVSAFGKPGQGWWSLETANILQNTNYTTGTSYNVSPGVNFSYRSFFTFDLSNPLLTGNRIIGAQLKLQAFLGLFDQGPISFYDVSTDPFVLNQLKNLVNLIQNNPGQLNYFEPKTTFRFTVSRTF